MWISDSVAFESPGAAPSRAGRRDVLADAAYPLLRPNIDGVSSVETSVRFHALEYDGWEFEGSCIRRGWFTDFATKGRRARILLK
jgi:hypothetical protein